MATKYRVQVDAQRYIEYQTEAEALAAYPEITPELITYTPYVYEPTWDDVSKLQNELFDNKEIQKRITRYETQLALTGKTPKETATKYQELLQYCQDIRDADETNHATPQLAIDALNALTVPTE